MKTTLRAAAVAMLLVLVPGWGVPDAGAQAIRQGTREIFMDGLVDPDGVAGTEWDLQIGSGWFVKDNLEVGGLVGFFDNGRDVKEWSVGVFGELHLPFQFPETGILPYVGLRISVVDVEDEPGPALFGPGAAAEEGTAGTMLLDETALEGTLRPGVKYFLSDALALDLGIEVSVASERIYVNDGDLDDVDWGFSGGVRAYF